MLLLHEEKCYIDGYLQALQDYAVYKDGSRFVGCGIYSLWEAGWKFLAGFGTVNKLTDEERIKILRKAGFKVPENLQNVPA